MPTFLLDENVHKPAFIIERCAAEGIEVLRVHQIDLNQTDDDLIMAHALEQGYIIVTGNIKDYRAQALAWIAADKAFAGALWLQNNKYRNVEAIIQAIIRIEGEYDTHPVKEWWLE